MSRPRTPTALHVIRGTKRKHPERMRERENEPVPSGPIGEPPEWLTDEQVKCWHELVSICPPGVLGNSDRLALELTVRLMVESRGDNGLSGTSIGHLISLLARFGLTPSDRSKVSVTKGDDKNPFSKFSQ